MRIVRLRGLFAIALLTITALAAGADHHVNGKWSLEVTLGDGQGGQATLDLKEESAGKLTGTYTGALGTVAVTGTVEGDQVEISFDSEAGKIAYSGKVSGDAMEGTCSYGQLGQGTFKGKREDTGAED
jgi:hypothetical protein